MRSLLLVVAAVDAAKDWRDAACLSSVVDEGATGRDVGIAAAAVDSIQCQSAETTRYSVEQIVDCAPHLQFNTSSALAYVLSAGLEEEAAYPAAARPEKCAYSAAKAAKKIAGVVAGDSDAAMAEAVAQHSPVTASMAVGDAYLRYTSGIITNCGGNATNHVVSVVGVADDHWVVKEAWGATWGEGGFALVARKACHLGEDFAYARL
jgi:hypothetical protein